MHTGPFSFIQALSLKQHRAKTDFPHLGRDLMDRQQAIFTITESLICLGHEGRTSALLRWLGRFDGLEMHLEEDEDPVLCVRQLLLQHVGNQPTNTKHRTWEWLISSILRLHFVQTHSCWGTETKSRIKWDPLAQTWMEFLEEGMEGETLSTWMPGAGNPDLARRSAAALLTGCV